jgi:hypothetical protein
MHTLDSCAIITGFHRLQISLDAAHLSVPRREERVDRHDWEFKFNSSC